MGEVLLPGRESSPGRAIWIRLGLALGAICFVAFVTYLDRDGFEDSQGQEIGLLEAFYYSTVSVTTTGYGDIVPATDSARLITTLLVTPARILFLIVLVGTTVELLLSRQREELRRSLWRRRLRDHIVICGYGVKGRAALEALTSNGDESQKVVAIDNRTESVEAAQADGLAAVHGDSTRTEVLQQAAVQRASTVIVAAHRDDTAVLTTLTVRQLNPTAKIVAAVREQENAGLLRQSGADSVIVSSGAAGRLMGIAAARPASVGVLEDLLSVGRGIDLVEREITAADVGPLRSLDEPRPVLAVVRGGRLLAFDDPESQSLRVGDHLVLVESEEGSRESA
jgi:voltage-gated potassium channel